MEDQAKKPKSKKRRVISLFKTLQYRKNQKRLPKLAKESKSIQTPPNFSPKIKRVKTKKIKSPRQSNNVPTNQKISSPSNKTPKKKVSPKNIFTSDPHQAPQKTVQTQKSPKHQKTFSQNKLCLSKKKLFRSQNQENPHHKKQKSLWSSRKRIKKWKPLKLTTNQKLRKSPVQNQQKEPKPAYQKPINTSQEKTTKKQRISQKGVQKEIGVHSPKYKRKSNQHKTKIQNLIRTKNAKIRIQKANAELKEVIRKNQRLQALLLIFSQQNRAVSKPKQIKKFKTLKQESPLRTIEIRSSYGDESCEITRWEFQSESEQQELPQSQLVQEFCRSLQKRDLYQTAVQPILTQEELNTIPELTPQGYSRKLTIPLLTLQKIKAMKSNRKSVFTNENCVSDLNSMVKMSLEPKICEEYIEKALSDSSTSILSVVDFSECSSEEEVASNIKSFRIFNEKIKGSFINPRWTEIENQNLVTKVMDREIKKFVQEIDFQLNHGEVDTSIQFTQTYSENLREVFQKNKQEILEKINTPFQRDALELLQELYIPEKGSLNKSHTLDQILHPQSMEELHTNLNLNKSNSRAKYLQMIFDCTNQALNQIRPFNTLGIPPI